ncbi:MAG: nicotinate-nucleotide--dimethylbenzimidazole phosphoribosyltransferase [Lachnospiraceae bacterium]|nr:nicotinate-nucleotide--dimethylbenzimidazole phosphoribosyltransferase [Lachnospiraceae bacterium]
MSRMELDNRIKALTEQIRPADQEIEKQSWDFWDTRCKPLRGFGYLEEMVVRLAGMTGQVHPSIAKRAVVIMGADNGVVEEGVSQCGPEVTTQVLENMGERKSSVCVMSQKLGAEVVPIDIGMKTPAAHPGVRVRVIRRGTGNIAKEPAMTRDECIRAILVGAETARELKEEGYELIMVGEMGIANTTTSSACACVMFDQDPEQTTGRGAGLSGEGLRRKKEVIRQALRVNAPDASDPVDILAKVGGLDIAGMTGLYLGAASVGLPAMIDGAISGIAAVLASRICPAAKDYMLPSHSTAEPVGAMITKELGLEPILFAGMHLGEATGAAMVLPLLDMALHVYETLPGFADSNVEQYEHLV